MKVIRELAPAQKVKPPVEVQLAEAKREIRALKKALRVEREHSVAMLAMAKRAVQRAWEAEEIYRGDCTCTPCRADFLRR